MAAARSNRVYPFVYVICARRTGEDCNSPQAWQYMCQWEDGTEEYMDYVGPTNARSRAAVALFWEHVATTSQLSYEDITAMHVMNTFAPSTGEWRRSQFDAWVAAHGKPKWSPHARAFDDHYDPSI